MNPLAPCFALLMTVGLALPVRAAESFEPAQAAIALGLGRLATAAEADLRESLTATISTLRENLAASPAQRHAVAERARVFVYGPAAEAAAVTSSTNALLFTEVAAGHLSALAQNQSAYKKVLEAAYQFVIGRGVYAEEIAYWGERPTLPYALLVGGIEDWARRNQPGLMVTAGAPTISINCDLLTTIRLSPAVATEARAAFGLSENSPVIAVGASGVASAGGINFVVVGVRDL